MTLCENLVVRDNQSIECGRLASFIGRIDGKQVFLCMDCYFDTQQKEKQTTL